MEDQVTCHICGKSFARAATRSWASVRPGISRLIEEAHAGWADGAHICRKDLGTFRRAYVENLLEQERGKLGELDRQVIEALESNQIVSVSPVDLEDRQTTFGERVADHVADFGGSWTFIITFAAVLGGWIALNVVGLFARPFDPYPFILLNLVLSCLAAIQAPVIMMSQNRQEAKDRLRSENDYRVNLKAELEIRHLHEKIDHLLSKQWERLVEIQQVQVELMSEITRRG